MADPPSLYGVDLKVARANRDLADLKESIASALHPDRYRISVERDPQTKNYVYRVYDVPAVEPDWLLQAGEILYQLRSALDHLAWQLVVLDGGSPSDKTQFPVRDSPLDRKGNARPLGTLMPEIKDPQILDLLNQCQPYSGTGLEQLTRSEAREQPLWRLRVLNNIDKHRLLLIAVCALDLGTLWWALPQGVANPLFRLNTVGLKDGTPIAWFDFKGAEPPPNFDPHPALQVVIREPDAARISHVNITDALSQLCWWVETHILAMRFRPLFP